MNFQLQNKTLAMNFKKELQFLLIIEQNLKFY